MDARVREKFGLLFKKEITDRAREVDPNEEQDWFSLSLGWALAHGMTPQDAHEFSIWLRYTAHYFVDR